MISDFFEVDGVHVPRYSLRGEHVLIAEFLNLGGTPQLDHSRYFQDFARDRGFAYVTASWPGVECAARKIPDMSVVRSIHQCEALFAAAAKEAAGIMRIILIGESVATTAVLRVGHHHRSSIDHIYILSAGDKIKDHMVAPQYEGDSEALLKQEHGQFKHLFFVPAHKPVMKQGLISCADLRKAQTYELFQDETATLNYMPPIDIFAGEKDMQILHTEQKKICSRIRIRPGEKSTGPGFHIVKGAGHLFTYEQMQPVGRHLQATIESYNLG